jgi:hypothetical protein
MLKPIFNVLQRWIASSERDRLETKFEKINTRFSDLENELDNKFTGVDERLDQVEKHQAAQNEKLTAIHLVTLANNEALGERVNSSSVTTEMVRQIVEARIDGFQESIKYMQGLLEQVLKRNYSV